MPMNPVAQRIQALLDSRNEKMKPTADKIGVGYYSVYPWWQRENAKTDPAKVKIWADYFGVTIEHLLYGDPINSPPNDYEAMLERAKSLEGDDKIALERVLRGLLGIGAQQ
jgi:transcriptional regulator with XRE-family HTH domain